MRVTAVAAAVVAALALAAPAVSAQPQIKRVVVRRAADGILTFRIEFTGPVVLGEDTRLRVAINRDQDPTTGNDGIDYVLDWNGRFPALLDAYTSEEPEANSSSLKLIHRGNVVTFSISDSDLTYLLSRFDFYLYADLSGALGDRASTDIPFAAGANTSTYPRDDAPYPIETYEDAGEPFPTSPGEAPGGATSRPDIQHVVVSRGDHGLLRFRIEFADAVTLTSDTKVQVAIDADRDPSTGVTGLEYSLDWTGTDEADRSGSGAARLLVGVMGEPVDRGSETLEFEHDGRFITFAVAPSELGDPERFDFYVFVRQGDVLDEAPSHVLFSAGAAPWTYPSGGVPAAGEPYPTETYDDLGDFTLSERGWTFLLAIVGGLLGLGAIVGVTGWSVERRRRRRGAPPPSPA